MSDNSNPANDQKNSRDDDTVLSTVANISDHLGSLETFITRKFAELSVEINASAAQAEMDVDTTKEKFGEILAVIHAISFKGDGNTAANTGVELDAVVDITEQAANKILDSADSISSQLHDDIDWSDRKEREKVLGKMDKDIENIFMACSFQDITGQRIRKTLDNLQQVETRLSKTLEKLGIDIPKNLIEDKSLTKKARSQEDIDDIMLEKDDKE